MGHQLPALMEARALAVVSFCRHERVRVLVVRRPDYRISKTCVVADAYWTSAEAHVFLYHPLFCKGVGRILLFLYFGRRVERMSPVLGFVPCRLGLWDGVVTWEEDDHCDRPVGPHCLLSV